MATIENDLTRRISALDSEAKGRRREGFAGYTKQMRAERASILEQIHGLAPHGDCALCAAGNFDLIGNDDTT